VRESPVFYEFLKNFENRLERGRHSMASLVPAVIRPRTYKVMIAITADCNARCHGCRYGRDFMNGSRLEWGMVRDALDDLAEAGFYSIRIYGGEPLLHPDLPRMVEHCVSLGMRPYVTTNAVLLDQKIDALVAAGLRDITVGFYGVGRPYDEYTQVSGLFRKVERGIAAVHERHGDRVQMQMNWLLMKPTASLEALEEATGFAERYGMTMRVDLIHYSLPYFQEGPDRCLQFGPEDRERLLEISAALVELKERKPQLLNHTVEGLRSIPDWLLLGPAMRVPCTAYEMIWIGADGSVQMCYVTFPLGNLHQRRLKELLFSSEHRCAARDAFKLKCPNCHCSSNERIMRHAPSLRKYGAQLARNGPATQGVDT
jgi:cyclic pyranopterin phosphate synthase